MRLVSFSRGGESRIGCPVDGQIVDLSIAAPSLPTDLLSLLEMGPEGMKQAEAAVTAAGDDAAIVGKTAKGVAREDGLDYVAGYTLFNDATLRDYQKKSTQWTIGKNFDNTGGFGPMFVTADELPAGADGLRIQSRLNGQVMQDANTSDFIFPIDDLIAKLSECMTLEVGDVIVTGTPAGVGYARNPPVFMKDGDVCEIEIEGIGVLSNPVVDEA